MKYYSDGINVLKFLFFVFFQFYCILEKGRKSIKLVYKIRLIYRTCDSDMALAHVHLFLTVALH